jgi:hypothetical protein
LELRPKACILNASDAKTREKRVVLTYFGQQEILQRYFLDLENELLKYHPHIRSPKFPILLASWCSLWRVWEKERERISHLTKRLKQQISNCFSHHRTPVHTGPLSLANSCSDTWWPLWAFANWCPMICHFSRSDVARKLKSHLYGKA